MSKTYRPRGDEGYYLQPASSSARRDHHRNYSAGNEDMTRLTTGPPTSRDRPDRGDYIRSGSGRERRGYNYDAPTRSVLDNEDDGGYEYTDRREQMYRDTAPKPRPRGDSFSGGRRPLSMAGMEDYLPRAPATRDGRPPVTNRGFDRIGQIESSRQGPRYNDVRPPDYSSDRGEAYEVPRRRPSTRKAVVHQEPEEAYKSYRDDYDDVYDKRPRESRKNAIIEDDVDPRAYGKREEPRKQEYDDAQTERVAEEKPRRHRKHRHRHSEEDADRDGNDRGEHTKDKHNRGEELLAGGLAAASVAGIAVEGSKHRHRREREARDPEDRVAIDRDTDRGAPGTRDPADVRKVNDDQSEEERRERRARRKERRRLEQEARDREELEALQRNTERNAERARDNLDPTRVNIEPPRVNMEPPRGNIEPPYLNTEPPRTAELPHAEIALQKQPSYERSPDSSPPQVLESTYRHRPRRRSPSTSSSTTSSTASLPPTTTAVRVVSPPTSHSPEPPKKGILRPPREKFPEDPMPVREGVAPLKDAGKKGIPPNARWTKINRELVNPEALEEGNERFEERVDYVIVLRVLTKEEIQEYARRTQAIRGERDRERGRGSVAGGPVGVVGGVVPGVGGLGGQAGLGVESYQG